MARPAAPLPRSWSERLRSGLKRLTLLGPDIRGSAESLAALAVLAVTAVIAGVFLGENTERLAELPGLLLMVPAAIALRGNIFGALGSRLGTAIHAGTFRPSLRYNTVVGENVLASTVLTLSISLTLAVLAKGMAVAFGVSNSISLGDYIVISLVGGVLASAVVLAAALALAAGSVRFGWDPDNVTAPLVTAIGDVATVPALLMASLLAGRGALSPILAGVLAVVSTATLVMAMVKGRAGLQLILRESIPVLVVAVILDLIAGITVEKRLDEFIDLPRLLVLLPAYLAAAGALGGILSSRLSSKLHLGTIEPAAVPGARARPDLTATFGLAVPVFILCASLAHLLGGLFGLAGPGLLELIGAALLGGLVATLVSMIVAYYGTIVAVRFGLDPDTYGIPLVTAAMDLVGAFTFIIAVEALGLV